MKLFEYQAKACFAEGGLSIPAGQLVASPDELDDQTPLPCVIKAQVLHGGRGKAGLIRFAETLDEARREAADLLDSGKAGSKLLIEKRLDIQDELYLSVTMDPTVGRLLVMASREGGVDIEQVAAESPEKIVRQPVDRTRGMQPYQARNVMFGLGLQGDLFKVGCKLVMNLVGLFCKTDAALAEINPLVITAQDELIAADGKLTTDDNAAFRQEQIATTREHYSSELEFEAAQEGFPYLDFDGQIGLMCAGAGLTNTVYDLICDQGGTVANYLEFGGPNYRRAVKAMDFTLRSKPKVILIVTFGTIARADVMAEGIAEAIKTHQPDVPIVTAIRGTNEEQAADILRSIGLDPLSDTETAVRRAVELCKAGDA